MHANETLAAVKDEITRRLEVANAATGGTWELDEDQIITDANPYWLAELQTVVADPPVSAKANGIFIASTRTWTPALLQKDALLCNWVAGKLLDDGEYRVFHKWVDAQFDPAHALDERDPLEWRLAKRDHDAALEVLALLAAEYANGE